MVDEDILNWEEEAKAVIGDVKAHCKTICVSSLPRNSNEIYLNIETLDEARHTIKMSADGFEIVGNDFDTETEKCGDQIVYETPYALLSSISIAYVNSFGNSLIDKLTKLNED